VQSSVPYCPVHKASDHIRQVSIIYKETSEGLLSPWPDLKAADRLAWIGTGCGVLGVVSIGVGNAVSGGAWPGLFAALFCFAYAIAFYGWAGVRRTRLTRVKNGMPRALAVWQEAWYCDLCDGVFLPSGFSAYPDEAGTGLMSAAQFRQLVWNAGGYGRRCRGPKDALPQTGRRASL
jgi:hypothetical protein